MIRRADSIENTVISFNNNYIKETDEKKIEKKNNQLV